MIFKLLSQCRLLPTALKDRQGKQTLASKFRNRTKAGVKKLSLNHMKAYKYSSVD